MITDRRPGTDNPLPFRGDLSRGEFMGYIKYDFLNECEGICVHHGGVSRDKCIPIDEYAKWHLDRWKSAGGIAYTYVIQPNGEIVQCWDNDLRVYSQGTGELEGDENTRWKGVLVVGNFSGPYNPGIDEDPTIEQMHSLDYLRRLFEIKYGMNGIVSHSELGKPACPGETLEKWVEINKNVFSIYQLDIAKGLQRILKDLGYYSGRIDEAIGHVMSLSIKEFQKDNGLLVDGIAGRKTKGKLRELLGNGYVREYR